MHLHCVRRGQARPIWHHLQKFCLLRRSQYCVQSAKVSLKNLWLIIRIPQLLCDWIAGKTNAQDGEQYGKIITNPIHILLHVDELGEGSDAIVAEELDMIN